jgi:hypothetical protein
MPRHFDRLTEAASYVYFLSVAGYILMAGLLGAAGGYCVEAYLELLGLEFGPRRGAGAITVGVFYAIWPVASVVTWLLLRSTLRQARGVAVVVVGLGALLLGATIFTIFSVGLSLASDLWEQKNLIKLVSTVLLSPIGGIVFAMYTAPVSVPFAVVSVFLMKGILGAGEPWRPRVADC